MFYAALALFLKMRVAEKASERVFSLPMHGYFGSEQVGRIVAALRA
jgi:dTDP-4-amino-4,6-dideoxygalactose transaminase